MKQPTFMEGVTVALAASLLGSVLTTSFTSFSGSGWVPRLLIAALGFGYIVYLLGRSHERVGRITTLAIWATLAGTIWLLEPSLPTYVVMHIGLIWLVRSLYFYSSMFSAFIDLGLNGLSLAAAIWAAHRTGSTFLSIWCFFLIQALFVYIPTSMSRQGHADLEAEHRFERAYQAAETALRKFSTIR